MVHLAGAGLLRRPRGRRRSTGTSSATRGRWRWCRSPTPGGVLLVRQYRPAVERWLYEIPAGTCDVDGEAARDHRPPRAGRGDRPVGRRTLTLLTRCLNTPGFCDEVTAVYLATGLAEVADDRQGVEERFLTVEEIPLDRFDDLVDDGTIVDAATILGVGLARRRLCRPAPSVSTPLTDGAEEYLSWLAVETGPVAQHPPLLPPRPGRLGGRGPRRPAWTRWPPPTATSGATWTASGWQGAARPRWPGPSPPSGASTASWSSEGTIDADPTRDLRSPKLPRRLPKALDEDQTMRLLDSVTGDRAVRPAGPGPAGAALRHRGPDLRGGRALPPRPPGRRRPAAGVRQGFQGAPGPPGPAWPARRWTPGCRRRAGPGWSRTAGGRGTTRRRSS